MKNGAARVWYHWYLLSSCSPCSSISDVPVHTLHLWTAGLTEHLSRRPWSSWPTPDVDRRSPQQSKRSKPLIVGKEACGTCSKRRKRNPKRRSCYVLGCWISHAYLAFLGDYLGTLLITDLLESHTIPILKCSETPTKTRVSAAELRALPSHAQSRGEKVHCEIKETPQPFGTSSMTLDDQENLAESQSGCAQKPEWDRQAACHVWGFSY
jgi:hypothetical protein